MTRSTHTLATLLLCACFALILTACDSDDDDDLPGGPIGGNAGVTATVDGADWTSATLAAAGRDETDTSFGFGGFSADGSSITISVQSLSTGTYSTTDEVFVGVYSSSSTAIPFSTVLGGSGTITVTSITAERVRGTFSFTASNGSGTVSVTNGEFDVTFID
ncbi:MAG: DUF6252 family protein [Bacteroidota bacterium]